jgi:hypothetical protein
MGASAPTLINACFNAIEISLCSPSTRKFKVTPSAGKVMLTVFLDFLGVLLVHFQKHGENVNSALYYEVLLMLWDAIRRKRPGQLARGVLFHHDNVDPHTA